MNTSRKAIFIGFICIYTITDCLGSPALPDWTIPLTDTPPESVRCQELSEIRAQNMEAKQKVQSLLHRAIKIYREKIKLGEQIARPHWEHLQLLKQELILSKLKVKHNDQELVVRACPENILFE